MAKAPATHHVPAHMPMAVLELRTPVLLPADRAAQLFAMLADGEHVHYDWSLRSYKPATDSDDNLTLKILTPAQLASLALNRGD